ncbi:MAG: poly-gamma-glutamate biosynthesis protein PgsC [Clostridium sp.]
MNDMLLLGIFLSLIFAELTDLSPGGIIVPAYFAMYAYDPRRILGTIVISILCVILVKFMSQFMILYGRRRFAVYVMTGIFLRMILGFAISDLSLSIGYLIPGILGRDMEKQGIPATLIALGIVTLLIRLVYIVVR